MAGGRCRAGGYYENHVRGHRTNACPEPHPDTSDGVGLLCVRRPAKRGGEKAGERLSPLQQAAIDCVRELSERDEFLLPMDVRPGGIQLVNNHVTLHACTVYEDDDEPDRKRLPLRLWLTIPNGRRLAPAFADRLNTGARGGVTKRL